MCFDVPKVVQSPGYDHGHDEESRNGRDIKIDILDDYVCTSEWFRVSSGIFRSTGELREFAGEYMGLIGPYGNRGERPKGRRHAPPSGPNWTRGAAPLSFFLSSSFPFCYSNKEGGSPTPGGSRTPLGAPPPWPASPSPLAPLYTGAGGTSRHTS